jgi:hypothetical protein
MQISHPPPAGKRLAPATAERAAKLIRLLGSDRDGEVLGAVAALRRTLGNAGHDLHSLAAIVAPPISPAPRIRSWRAPAESDWQRMATFCFARQGRLSLRDRDFVKSMRGWRGTPTPGQQSWLLDLFLKCGGDQ